MNTSNVPQRQRDAYEKVMAYLKKHPGSSILDATGKKGGLRTDFYQGRKKMIEAGEIEDNRIRKGNGKAKAKRKYAKRKVKMLTLPVEDLPTPTLSMPVVAFLGSPAQVVSSIREMLRG